MTMRNVQSGVGIPSTRQEVETLIGRTTENVSLGTNRGRFEVTYWWRGVFRAYALRANYLRLPHNLRLPLANPLEGHGGVDVLQWISNRVE